MTRKQDSDEIRWSSLMASTQAGDETAYRKLLEELSGVTRNFLVSRFGHGEFIDDCVQEILISIHKARHTYDPARPFRAWFFAIVRHRAIDMFRQRSTRTKAAESYKREQEIHHQPADATSTYAELTDGRLLESLPEPQREALVLTKIIGYSGAETADRLGISESAVKVRVHRAIGSLRRMLEKEEPV